MEADWEIEMDADAPQIEACWTGFVDLRQHSEHIDRLLEACAFPPLGQALLRLNAQDSPVWSSKCDFWPRLEAGDWNADEMEARPERALQAAGCYIDLLLRAENGWDQIPAVENSCRLYCARLSQWELPGARVDWIARRAWTGPEQATIGVTTYATACGATERDAVERLSACLELLVRAVVDDRCEKTSINATMSKAKSG